MDSPDQTSNDQLILEATPSEAGAPLKEGILVRGPSNVDEIGEGSPSGVTATPILSPKFADTVFSRRRLPDQVLRSTYVPSQERIHPPAGMVAHDLEGAREIIHHWSPFNPVMHMHDLYPNYFRVLVVTPAEQYSIPFLVYMDKKALSNRWSRTGCFSATMTFTDHLS